MDYFVNIEKTDYELWQAELLIESFNYNNCSEKLLCVICENKKDICYPIPLKNVFDHKRGIISRNVGEERGYKPLNALYNLFWMQNSNLLKQPFALLSPDMVLRKDINFNFNDPNLSEIVFAPYPELTFNAAVDAVGPFWEYCQNDQKYYQENWIPFGCFALFNCIPLNFFYRTIFIAESLAVKQLIDKKEIWKHTDKLAWTINMADSIGQLFLKGDYQIVDAMFNNSESSIIHYEHGLPPSFNKTEYLYQPPAFLSNGNPFEIIAQNPATANAHFMSNLAKNILSKE